METLGVFGIFEVYLGFWEVAFESRRLVVVIGMRNLAQICLDLVEAKNRISHRTHTADTLSDTRQGIFNSIWI